VEFNPLNPLRLTSGWDPNHRDYRKLLVVDDSVGFTGGVNISSTYANSSLFRSKARSGSQVGWRDTHIQIEGPAVAALQWEFLNSWSSQQLLPLSDSNFFPPLKNVGNKLIRVLASEPGGSQEIYKTYILAIAAAKMSVHITGAYLVPDEQLLAALGEAAARGVEVKIILPGVKESGVAYYASHSFFQEMLERGIRLFLLHGSVLHAKTAVIDGVWSTVGSTNMDNRSFLHHHELNVVVFDEAFGAAMDIAFEDDLALTDEVTLPEWEKRLWWERVKEWAARRFAYWL
jgi:cardiolipin synthase A/B